MELKQLPKLLQKLVITPKLQLSLKLLQLNRLELEELVRQELEENPFLEIEAEETGETLASAREQEERQNPQGETSAEIAGKDEAPEPAEENNPEGAFSTFDKVDVDWEDYYSDAENPVYVQATPEEKEQRDFTQYTAAKTTLYQHLYRQLRVAGLEGKDFEIGEYIIGNLDHKGFLRLSLEEIAEKFDAAAEEVEKVLKVVQGFEPPGIAARSLKECLRLQLLDKGELEPLVYRVLEEYFEPLTQKKFDFIARQLNVPREEVEKVFNKISHLDPRPARNLTAEEPQYIQPDLFVEKDNGKYLIYLNQDDATELRINSYYRNLLRKKELSKEERRYAKHKYRAALWLIKNIQQRRNTLLRVTGAIMELQRDFLEKGIEHLKPLTLREVAEKIGMHGSTVQRAATNKYVQTPRGLYELKFFFSRGIDKRDGESMSSTAVKSKLQELVASEDAERPLSDQKLAEMIKKEGINIARRTVAKYREQLGILPVKQRRKQGRSNMKILG